MGHGSGSGGLRAGWTKARVAFLEAAIAADAARCRSALAKASPNPLASARIETTDDEIVAIHLTLRGEEAARACFEEALWDMRLDKHFDRDAGFSFNF